MVGNMYAGQPDYVRAGFLCDLFEPWIKASEGDEWGEHLRALHDVMETSLSFAEDRALIVADWIREDISRAFDENWWDNLYDYDDWRGIYKAQDNYDHVVEYWRDRAVTFKGQDALEEVIAALPEWVRPMPNRLPKPDKERQEYERLKAKFDKQ